MPAGIKGSVWSRFGKDKRFMVFLALSTVITEILIHSSVIPATFCIDFIA